jgi:pyruvyltransferase
MRENKKLKMVHLKLYQEYPNAGDQFSLALARHYFATNIIPSSRNRLTVPNLILIGSYLIKADAYSHICGAGFIASTPSLCKLSSPPKAIHCVRGPLTAELLSKQGIHCPKVYADPGILAPELYPRRISPSNKVGIIPHFKDANLPWINSCRNKGVTIIDVLSPLSEYFLAIQKCNIILSSSLHGIIFAHAYGIPALWIEVSDNVIGDGFKFLDYYLSIGVQPEKVQRVRVSQQTDPYEIMQMATVGNVSRLLTPLKEAMFNAKKQLHQDQRYINVQKFLFPFNSRNRAIIAKKLCKTQK